MTSLRWRWCLPHLCDASKEEYCVEHLTEVDVFRNSNFGKNDDYCGGDGVDGAKGGGGQEKEDLKGNFCAFVSGCYGKEMWKHGFSAYGNRIGYM